MTESVAVHCPQCSVRLKLKVSAAITQDKKITCPQCGADFIVDKEILQPQDGAESRPSKSVPAKRSEAGSSSTPKLKELKEPGLKEPGLKEPGLKEPGMKEPGMKEPGMKEPGMKEPGFKEPGLKADKASQASGATPATRPGELKSSKSSPPMAAGKTQSSGANSKAPASEKPTAKLSAAASSSKKTSAKASPAKGKANSVRKKSTRDEFEEDQYDEGNDLWNGTDSYGDDEWASTPDESDDVFTSPKKSPPARSSGKGGAGAKLSARSEDTMPKSRQMGVVGWFLFGSLGGLAGFLLTLATGFTRNDWIIGGMAALSGLMTGVGVRYGAGYTYGIGPALVAGMIALASIFGGKVGAYLLIQGLPPTEEEKAAQAQADADHQKYLAEAVSDNVLTSEIASQVHQEWLKSGKITQQQIDAWYQQQSANQPPEDPSRDYLPEVWAEATKRWNALNPQQKAAKQKEIQSEWYGEDGLDPQLNPVSEADAITWYADEIEIEWMDAGKITEEQMDAVYEANAEPVDFSKQYMPEIWAEAQTQWQNKSDEEKNAARDKARSEYEELASFGDSLIPTKGLVAAVLSALFNCFVPKFCLICVVGGMSLAWRIGGRGTLTPGG